MASESNEVARAHLADAGVEELPDDWDVVTLGDLFTKDRGISVGVMYPGDHDPDGVPLIKAGDLNGSIINPRPDFRISKEKHHEYRRTELEGGELLMTLVGNVGQCAVVPKRMAGWNTARAVAVMRLADSSETHFVQQCLLSRPLQHLMDVWCNTTVQATLNLKEIRQLPLPWPPKKSRDAIAAFGKALDDKIELNRRMNATLEGMARALFQSWFVDFDPVRAKLDGRKPEGMDKATAALFTDAFEESSLGPVPKGWKVKALSELCQLGRGASPRPINDYMNGEVPWVKIADATAAGGPFLYETREKVKKAGAEKSVAVAPGDLILSNSATCGVPMFVELHGCIHDGWLYFKNLRSISKLYLFHVLIELAEHLVHIADGSVQKNLNTNLVGQQNVLVPPKEIADAFDAQATVWFSKMRQNGLESRTLATLRDTLLPKLLSGELSVASTKVKA